MQHFTKDLVLPVVSGGPVCPSCVLAHSRRSTCRCQRNGIVDSGSGSGSSSVGKYLARVTVDVNHRGRQECVSTGPRSAVVSASDCGSEGLGFESHQSHVGFFSPSSALAGSYPELGVLWAQWEGWNHTAELHPLHGCVFEGVALII